MFSIRRFGWTLVVVLVGTLASAGPAVAQASSPDADVDLPFDLGALLPARIGAVELAVETRGPEEMEDQLQTSDNLLLSTLRAVLTESERASTPISMALASPADPGTAEQYEFVALHVRGTDAAELLSRMFRHMMVEQIRAGGVEDPEEIERMTAGFESILPRLTIAGRDVLSPDEGADTTFEFFYPHGEVLFIVSSMDGVSMEEVLAGLP